ncbi:MAG: hypothetical protein BEU00_01100 [Marine Group III euryarchaeote CG-Epi3]|jgi:hypothetical protein|uniref:Uncharacterized protein n=1 Tax=Marine Group III euryarchaeote CG-Epi3 TaxID=1888997 RepID=A0A1J5U2L4_9ARCH|nr:MAG: hypothetical protein BEU00_01100 [Marine Group III euryarchaeote CG-Epi3]
MAYPPNGDDLTEARTTIVNILKMEGYKLDSGSLFLAFKDAGGEMSQFAPSLEELQEENIIKSDSEGNIMTVDDYQREQSQNIEDSDSEETPEEEESDLIDEEIEDIVEEENSDDDEMEEMLRKKEETDAWIIEKAKNGSKTNENLNLEIVELKNRVEKLEEILKKINEALK